MWRARLESMLFRERKNCQSKPKMTLYQTLTNLHLKSEIQLVRSHNLKEDSDRVYQH
jgi:hypothetical protein